MAIRVVTGPLPLRDVVARHLVVSSCVLVASLALIARMGESDTPATSGDFPCLGQGSLTRSRDRVLHDARGHRLSPPIRSRFASDNIIALCETVIAGPGLTILPQHCCHVALSRDQLHTVLSSWTSGPADLYAPYPPRAGVPPSVKALVAFLREHFAVEATMQPLK